VSRLNSGIVTVGSLGLMAGVAAAAHWDAKPEHVSVFYDEQILDRYRPKLVMPQEAREKFIGLYGWVAESPERDLNCCCYWASYTHQDGYLGNLDSHMGDHEPVYCFYDKNTGEVQRVIASVYHWLKGSATGTTAPLVDQTHVNLRTVVPWHQYTAASDEGAYFDVRDLTTEFDSWLSNGLDTSLHPGTVTNPWSMQHRSSWWRDGLFGFSLNEFIVKRSADLGRGTVGDLEATA
jgi:hypothetical protein